MIYASASLEKVVAQARESVLRRVHWEAVGRRLCSTRGYSPVYVRVYARKKEWRTMYYYGGLPKPGDRHILTIKAKEG